MSVSCRAHLRNEILKFKKFQDAEYTVVDVETSRMRLAINGKFDEYEALSNVWIEHKGHRVSVGTGFTAEERVRYGTDPSQIVRPTSALWRASSGSKEDVLISDRPADDGRVLLREPGGYARCGRQSAVPAGEEDLGWGAGCVASEARMIFHCAQPRPAVSNAGADMGIICMIWTMMEYVQCGVTYARLAGRREAPVVEWPCLSTLFSLPRVKLVPHSHSKELILTSARRWCGGCRNYRHARMVTAYWT